VWLSFETASGQNAEKSSKIARRSIRRIRLNPLERFSFPTRAAHRPFPPRRQTGTMRALHARFISDNDTSRPAPLSARNQHFLPLLSAHCYKKAVSYDREGLK
jgi:hypothetical protein